MKPKKPKLEEWQVPAMPPDEGEDLDWSKAERVVMPNLRPSTQTISLRLPVSLLHRLKVEANRRDVPYQSYMKVLLTEALDRKTT